MTPTDARPPVFLGDEGRYQLLATIGEGGAGTVFRAWDRKLERQVAIKRLRPPSSGLEPGPQGEPESLFREARTLSSLHHPNIVTIHDFGLDLEGAPFAVMELIAGEPLDLRVERSPLDLEAFFSIAEASLEALLAAHQKGFLHRDIKPSNIMIEPLPTGSLQVKLLDFGLAKFAREPTAQTIDHTGAILGSIHYMAPEQFERAPLDERTDIYQLGCVFYFALTSRPPFTGDSGAAVMAAHLQNQVIPIQDLRPDLPPLLAGWVHHLLQREPASRPSSARDSLLALRALRAGLASLEPTPSREAAAPPPPDARAQRRHLLWASAAVWTLLLVSAAWFFWVRNPAPPPPISPAAGAALPQPAHLQAPELPALATSTPVESASLPLSVPSAPPPPPESPVFDPLDLPGLEAYLNREIILEGTIVHAGQARNGNPRFLNFTQERGQGVALVFRDEDGGQAFPLPRLQTYLDARIRVRGTLTLFRDSYQIIIQREDQLQTLVESGLP